MLRRKQAGMPLERQREAALQTYVVNMMDALRRSIDGRSRRRSPSGGKPCEHARRGRTGVARSCGNLRDAMATRKQFRTAVLAKVKGRVSKRLRKKRTRPEPRHYTLADLDRAQDRVEAAKRRVDSDRTNRLRSRAGLERAQRELSIIESDLRARGLF